VIRLLEARDPALLDRLRDARADGDVPLVLDERWPAAQREALARWAETAALPADAGWATATSGSSGSPRIVLRTAASWSASHGAVAALLDAGPDDVVALPAPASFSLTLYSLAHALEGGPRPAIGPAGTEATHLHGTPEALRQALEARPPRLRTALIGGSHLDPALRQRAEAAGIRVVAYYGAAELSFVAADDGTGLRPFPGVELRVADGVLWVRSPFVALGYAGALSGPLRTRDGWATVGDRAELVDGRLRLLGREDDAVLSASATIVPEEVEAVLRSAEGVRDVVVFGVERRPVGALVAALVESSETGTPPTLGRLRAVAGEQLAPAHRPRLWFTGPVPRTAAGKPARGEVARRAAAGELVRLG
jgi:acyl-CoA synthetase (AMP-forming)/AMP-acid ligase II